MLLAGAQVANESLDSSGFEMSFRDDLLGGGTAGVTSLNGLTGALAITPGNGISITLPSYVAGLSASQRTMTLLDVSRIVPLTGGADFSADVKDFTPVFKAIAEEIRSGYTLAYYPPESSRHDGRAHQIRVEVRKSGAIVRSSRNVYQAPSADKRK